jgi:hypothetical protein
MTLEWPWIVVLVLAGLPMAVMLAAVLTFLFCEFVLKPRPSIMRVVNGIMWRSYVCFERCGGLAALFIAGWVAVKWVTQGSDSPFVSFLAILIFGLGGWNMLHGQRSLTINIGGKSRSKKKTD